MIIPHFREKSVKARLKMRCFPRFSLQVNPNFAQLKESGEIESENSISWTPRYLLVTFFEIPVELWATKSRGGGVHKYFPDSDAPPRLN